MASAPKKGVAGLRMESAPAPLAVPSGDDQEDQDNQDDHDHDNTGDTGDNSVIEALDSLNIRDTQDDDENWIRNLNQLEINFVFLLTSGKKYVILFAKFLEF